MNSNVKRFRSIYGASASISVMDDGMAHLTVYDWHGEMIIDKDYKSERSAKIAMGKASDYWHEVK